MTIHNSDVVEPAQHRLDTSGLECPLPLLKTKAALAKMGPGELLRIIATDPHAPIDIEAFCLQIGHDFIGHGVVDEGLEIFIRKSAG